MNIVTLLLSPQGRIPRGWFWIGLVIVLAVSVALNLIPGRAGRMVGLVLLWPQICINVKRLHDMGHTGWLLLGPTGITLASLVLSFILGSGAESYPAPGALAPLAVAALCSLAFLLWVGLSRGVPEDNRFGPVARAAA